MFDSKLVADLRSKYPEGTRIKLIFMNDKYAPPEGSKGTVSTIDDLGQIHMKWDNGSTLAIIPSDDKFEIVKE